jgi:hypothetical protein
MVEKDPRAGRGSGNGGNANWYNSPFWSKTKNNQKTVDEAEATCEASEHQQRQDDEADWKIKAKILQRSVY